MTISRKNFVDILFGLFVISNIIMQASPIGKVVQLLFILFSVLFSFRSLKWSTYHFFEILFVAYVWIQCLLGIAVNQSATLNMSVTMSYYLLYSIGTYNYLVSNEQELEEKIQIYSKASLIGFVLVILFYGKTLLVHGRLSCSSTISIGGLALLGGSSAVALAMQALIPSFFINLMPPKHNSRTSLLYTLFFALIAILTGTRKVLILFAFVFVVERELIKPGKHDWKILKILFISTVSLVAAYIILMNVPFLYKLLGSRIESAVNFYVLGIGADSSIVVRNRMIDRALDLYNQRKMFGWGMDFFKYSNYSELGYYSHNNFLELLSGGGTIGFALYYIKYVYILLGMLKMIKNQKNKISQYGWLSCVIFFVLMIIIEYWQITYFYRYILLYQIFFLAMIKMKYKWND